MSDDVSLSALAPVAPAYLTEAQCAALLGFARSTLELWRRQTRLLDKQVGPPFITIGARVRYSREAALAWIESCPKGGK